MVYHKFNPGGESCVCTESGSAAYSTKYVSNAACYHTLYSTRFSVAIFINRLTCSSLKVVSTRRSGTV